MENKDSDTKSSGSSQVTVRPLGWFVILFGILTLVQFQNCGKPVNKLDAGGTSIAPYPAALCTLNSQWSSPLVTYQYVSGFNSFFSAMAADSQGGIYVAGYGFDATSVEHWIVQKSNDSGQSWVVIDDYQLAPGKNAVPSNAALLVFGNAVFATGQAIDSAGHSHWIIRKSANLGETWVTANDYQYATNENSTGGQVGFDSFGNLYAVGTGVDSTSKYHSVVRESTDGGNTWAVLDDFQYGGTGLPMVASELGVSPLGNIFAAGSGQDSKGVSHWYVRMGMPGGATWSTVDDYIYQTGFNSQPQNQIAFDSSGAVYVTGGGSDAFGSHWIVRKGTSSGTNWSNIDNFQYQTGASSASVGLFMDSLSNYYVLGTGLDQTTFNEAHFNVRKSTDLGTSWSTLEDYVYQPAGAAGEGTFANGITVDSAGNIYVALSATDSGDHWHGLIMKLSCIYPSPAPSPTP